MEDMMKLVKKPKIKVGGTDRFRRSFPMTWLNENDTYRFTVEKDGKLWLEYCVRIDIAEDGKVAVEPYVLEYSYV